MCKKLYLLLLALTLIGCAKPHSTDSKDQVMKQSLPSFVKKADDKYTLTRNDIVYTVSPSVGGRIESLQFQGEHTMLTPSSGSDDFNRWGNVFWPSPQADWGWPPLPVLDYKPYSVSVAGDFLVLTSDVEPQTNLQFEKHYGFSQAENTVHIRYRIYNRGDVSKTLAPWEITRFPPQGLSFFPEGKGEDFNGNFTPLPVTTKNNITWFDYNADELGPGDHKLMIDGAEGWLAYLNNDILFVKVFDDIKPEQAAPNEGEIEIYAKGIGIYIEVEQQGAYTTIEPGDSIEWNVQWALVSFSSDSGQTNVGNELLIEKTRAMVNAANAD